MRREHTPQTRRRVLGALGAGAAFGLTGAVGSASATSFGGIEHEPLGGAALEATSDELLVDAGGDGGVRAYTEGGRSFGADVDPFMLDTDGQALQFTGTGTLGGQSGVTMGETVVRNDGGELAVEADFRSVGAEATQLDLFRGGELVESLYYDPYGPLFYCPPWWWDWWWWCPPWPCYEWPCCYCWPCWGWEWIDPVEIRTVDDRIIEADAVRIGAAEPEAQVEGLDTFDVRTQGVEQFSVLDEQLE
jgi:hypothetical protein